MIDRELLNPPGEGLFTVGARHPLVEQYQKYRISQEKNQTDCDICVLGIPSDNGGGVLRGANWGPIFIRDLIKDLSYQDLGDIKCIPHFLSDELLNEKTILSARRALYQTDNHYPVSPLSITELVSRKFYQHQPQKKLFGIGGDNSISYPLFKSWLETRKDPKRCGLIHLDAHTDFSKERLGVPITFGSWAYHAVQLLPRPQQFLQFGVRKSSHPKQYWEGTFAIKQFWSDQIQKFLPEVLAECLLWMHDHSIEEIYISLDLDVLDPEYFSLTGTPEANGLSPHQLICLIKELSSRFNISGCDISEYAPFLRTTNLAHIPEPENSQLNLQLVLRAIWEALS